MVPIASRRPSGSVIAVGFRVASFSRLTIAEAVPYFLIPVVPEASTGSVNTGVHRKGLVQYPLRRTVQPRVPRCPRCSALRIRHRRCLTAELVLNIVTLAHHVKLQWCPWYPEALRIRRSSGFPCKRTPGSRCPPVPPRDPGGPGENPDQSSPMIPGIRCPESPCPPGFQMSNTDLVAAATHKLVPVFRCDSGRSGRSGCILLQFQSIRRSWTALPTGQGVSGCKSGNKSSGRSGCSYSSFSLTVLECPPASPGA